MSSDQEATATLRRGPPVADLDPFERERVGTGENVQHPVVLVPVEDRQVAAVAQQGQANRDVEITRGVVVLVGGAAEHDRDAVRRRVEGDGGRHGAVTARGVGTGVGVVDRLAQAARTVDCNDVDRGVDDDHGT
jgi:hypothetical protein